MSNDTIERELGSIDARLKNIELALGRHGTNHDKLWERIDDTKKAVNELYVRVAVISTLISSLVSGIPFLLRVIEMNK